MQWQRWWAPLVAWTFLALAGAAVAGQTMAAPLSRAEVREWLLRIHEAARRNNFQGTFVVSAGGQVASARIVHYCEGPNQFERIESLDGQMRKVFRHNATVITLWPASRTAMVEHRETLTTFPGLLQSDGERLTDHYDVHRLGVERVAGHEADVLLVKPKDTLRYGYRLWSERKTGLLLRAEMLDEQDQVLESSAFSDVAIGVKPQPEAVLGPMKRLDGYKVARPEMVKTSFEQEGWTFRAKVPGFRQVSVVRRGLKPGVAQEVEEAAPAAVLQAIFSDGLAHVSLFVEPYDAKPHRKEMLVSMGATQTLTQRYKDWWITAVGEVPPAGLRLFVQGLERRP
ncbi:MAG: MucB/RseB C-terminal domain-containing protein [Pseudomonadota bacterium]|uniref:MucB/RseB C-terminal domain-containing protein n=1 Tax=Caldimonas aquatica TaxID=376175 RepID=A0ABY6MU40_9BURK|nr:MucB/RseB C-terminal domain-containing protein [Schlegelella aquatica]UZD55526.1 MucB/RseB C-terminal domain-containing protein [Schlegelella aquatica]